MIAGPLCLYIQAKEGMDADALNTLEGIGADILRKPVVTSYGDIQQMLKFSPAMIIIKPTAAEERYKVDAAPGSLEDAIVQRLDIEHPLIINALLDNIPCEDGMEEE